MTSYRHETAILKSAVTLWSSRTLDNSPDTGPERRRKSRSRWPVCWLDDDRRRAPRAGGGSRFAGSTHKLLATIEGVPVFRRALDHLTAAGFDHVVVVTGAVALEIDEPQCDHGPQPDVGARTGGFAAARGRGSAAISAATSLIVGLADQPFVPADRVAGRRQFRLDGTDRRRHLRRRARPNPVRLQRSVWPHVPTDGDEGARTVMRLHRLGR